MGWHGKTLSFGVVSKSLLKFLNDESLTDEETEFFQVPMPFQRNKACT